MADTAYWGTLHARIELLISPSEQVDECFIVEIVTGCKVCLGGRLGKFIPRTHQLAVVTTVNAISHEGAQRWINRALMLNSEV